MKLEELCNALGFSEKEYAVLTPFFAEFQENCSESFPHFMAPDDAMKYFPYVQRDIDIRPRMEKVAGIVAGNPAAAGRTRWIGARSCRRKRLLAPHIAGRRNSRYAHPAEWPERYTPANPASKSAAKINSVFILNF